MKKKIMFVSNAAWNIYNFRLGLMSFLKKKGFSVISAAPYDEYTEKINKIFKCIPVKMNRRGTNPLKDLKLLIDLFEIYKKEKPDLIIHYTIKANVYGSLAARLNGIKSISVLTGLGYMFLSFKIFKLISLFLYRRALKFASMIIFQNNDDRNYFIKEKIVNKKGSVLILGSGVDTDYFTPGKSPPSKNKDFIILFVGRFLKDKGILEFFNAALSVREKYSDVSIHLVGAIDKGNPASISEKELNIWKKILQAKHFPFTGDIRKYYMNSNVVVLPSYREGLSRVLLEAGAMKKPIITTNTTGCREIVEHNKNGFLVPVKSVSALVEAMINIKEMPSGTLTRMGQYSRNKILKSFCNTVIFKQYLKVINSVV